MIMIRQLCVGLLLVTSCVTPSTAYEILTHRGWTGRAADLSVLRLDATLIKSLGIDKAINDPTQRYLNSNGDLKTIIELLQDGVEFEDNISLLRSPREARVLYHFYNPVNGQGLSQPPFLSIPQRPSPDWALAPRGSITAQRFSYPDARHYMYNALTKPDKTEREQSFGLMFQTVGHVVHHVQDMAQPQHVRNDIHCPYPACALANAHAPSWYEHWTDLREVRDGITQRYANPDLAGYNITGPEFLATFNTPRRFWHTEPPGPNSPANGKGMAEFTNRNFVSAGTNFDLPTPPNFALPAFDPARSATETVLSLCAKASPPCSQELLQLANLPANSGLGIKFYATTGRDNFTGLPVENPKASSESLFDEHLQKLGDRPVYALNRFTFDDAYRHLIPRTIALSAGLINYFFRGKLEVEGQGATQLLVKNASREAMRGDFALYYDDTQDVRRPVAITACSVGGVEVPVADGKCTGVALTAANPDPGMPLQITITPPTAPAQKVPGEYMVVFAGDLGEEKTGDGNVGAVVAKQIRAIGGALYISARDNLGRQVFLRADASGTAVLTPGDGQFNPLISLSPQNMQKAYSMRQVRFFETGPGVYGYQPQALTIGNIEFGSRVTQGLVKNASTNTFDNIGAGESWLANSPAPEIGEFTFRTVVTSPTTGALQYTRRYRGADGKPAVETGSVALPSLGQRNMTYYRFQAGLLHVSGDGLTISGLIETPLTGGGAVIHYDLVIGLGLPPTVNLVEKLRETANFTDSLEPYSTPSLGPFTTTARCDPAAPSVTRDLVAEVYREKSDQSQRQIVFIGYLNNQLASYQLTSISNRQILGERITGFVPAFGQGPACDAIGGWTRRQRRGTVRGQAYFEKQAIFSDATLTHSRRIVGIQNSLNGRQGDLRTLFAGDVNRTWDYAYEGGALLAPPFEFKNLEVSDVTTGNNFSIV